MSAAIQCCAVIPVYNHKALLDKLVSALLGMGLSVILVDDGCDTECANIITLLAKQQSVYSCKHISNRGKGAAVKTGLRFALSKSFSHAFQIDADGQHNLDDIETFIALAQKHPKALIAGYPEYDESIPKLRYYARYLTHVWIWINTLSTVISDSMCGFRIYPLAESVALIDSQYTGDRMDYDPEFAVRWYWSGAAIVQQATRVIYPENGVSHFKLFTDNKLITLMHTRLFLGMLIRIPRLLALRWKRV